MKLARDPASGRPMPCAFLKNAPGILPVRRSSLTLVGRKQTMARYQIRPQNPPPPPQFAPLFFDSCYRTRVQRSPGSSTIKLPTALAESGAYEPDRACHGTLARATVPYQTRLSATVPCHPPLACHRPLEGHFLPNGTKLALAKRRTGWIPSLTNQTAAASQPTG